MTSTLDQVDTSVLDSLDFEKVCEVRLAIILDGRPTGEVPCERPAAWLGNYPCCGHLSILCKHHTFEDPTSFYCIPCANTFTIDKLVALRPLK